MRDKILVYNPSYRWLTSAGVFLQKAIRCRANVEGKQDLCVNLSLEMSFTVESTVKIMHPQPRKIPPGIVTVSTQSVHNSSPAVRSERCPDCIRNTGNIFNITRKTLAWKTAFPAALLSLFFFYCVYVSFRSSLSLVRLSRRTRRFVLLSVPPGGDLGAGCLCPVVHGHPAQRANAMVMANDRCIKWSWVFNGHWRSDAAAGNRGKRAGGAGGSQQLSPRQAAGLQPHGLLSLSHMPSETLYNRWLL